MNSQQTELIQRQLLEFFNSQTGAWGECDRSMNLIEQGVLDSLLVTDLVLFVQNQFGIELTPRDISPANLSSIERMAELIRQKQERAGQAA